MAVDITVTVVWVILGAVFLLQYKRLSEDPSKGDGRTPPQRWRILGIVFLALAAIRVLDLATRG
jgi:hypothetical protein